MNKKEYAKPAIVAKAIDAEPMLAGSVMNTNTVDERPESEKNVEEENAFSKQNTVNTIWDD